MWLGEEFMFTQLGLDGSSVVVQGAWRIAALSMPLNALAFVTDGVHWGTRDYRYLRNAMLLSTGVSILWLDRWLQALSESAVTPEDALATLWWITCVWIAIRALLGTLRIWPGVGNAPLK